jgi:hypothetical protein
VRCLVKIEQFFKFEFARSGIFTTLTFRGIKCTFDTAADDNFYSIYRFSYNSVDDGFLQVPCLSLTILESKLILTQNLGKPLDFPTTKNIKPYFFGGSSAHWTLTQMTTSSLYMFRYKSIIDYFASRALGGTILERELFLVVTFRKITGYF